MVAQEKSRLVRSHLVELDRRAGKYACAACAPPTFEVVESKFALHSTCAVCVFTAGQLSLTSCVATDQPKVDAIMKKLWNRPFFQFLDLSQEVQTFNEDFGPRVAFYFAFINAYDPVVRYGRCAFR